MSFRSPFRGRRATACGLLAGLLFLPAGSAAAEDATPAPATLTLAATPAIPAAAQASAFFVGTATVILRYGPFTLLTDPNFLHQGEAAHLGYGLTSKRLTNPAIDIDALPPIDLVLLSHYHGDHFDEVVEARLNKNLPIVTTPAAVKHLRNHGFESLHPLKTWQSLEVSKGGARLRLTALPGRHGPPLVALALPEVMGTMVEFLDPRGKVEYRLYLSGDTRVFDELREIPKRFAPIDLALLHLGGTRLLGVLVTMDAAEGLQMLQLLDPDLAVPLHYDDYPVFKSPLEDFLAAARQAGFENRLRVLRHGDSLPLTPR